MNKFLIFVIGLCSFSLSLSQSTSTFYLELKCPSETPFYADAAALPSYKDLEKKTMEILIKKKCKGRMENFLGAGYVFFCNDKDEGILNYEIQKKFRAKGKSCQIDEDCINYDKPALSLECVDGKCKDKCGNACNNNEFCKGTDFDYSKMDYKSYHCIKIAKERDTCQDTSECSPGLLCFKEKQTDENKRCLKYGSIAEGEYSASKELCETGYLYANKCASIKTDAPCTKDKYYEKATLNDGTEVYIDCYTSPTKTVVPYDSIAKINYWKNMVMKEYKKIDLEKLVKKDKNKIKYLFGNKKLWEYYNVHKYWMELQGQDIIDKEGEPQSGKKLCYEFGWRVGTSSYLKISLILLSLLVVLL